MMAPSFDGFNRGVDIFMATNHDEYLLHPNTEAIFPFVSAAGESGQKAPVVVILFVDFLEAT